MIQALRDSELELLTRQASAFFTDRFKFEIQGKMPGSDEVECLITWSAMNREYKISRVNLQLYRPNVLPASQLDLGLDYSSSNTRDCGQVLIDLILSNDYQTNIKQGEPRPGHPEGAIQNHIKELENNLAQVDHLMSDEEVVKLLLLAHAHDTFKPVAQRRVAITHPQSHASLAAATLRQLGAPNEIVQICQYHDYPYACYLKWIKGFNHERAKERFISFLKDTNRCPNSELFLAFNIIDSCTAGKSSRPLEWGLSVAEKHGLLTQKVKDIYEHIKGLK